MHLAPPTMRMICQIDDQDKITEIMAKMNVKLVRDRMFLIAMAVIVAIF